MFIEIEGIEAAGKTTQAFLLKKWIETQGLEAVVVKELGSTSFSRRIKKILLENGLKDGRAEMFLFLSCKSQIFSQVIMPSLAQGKYVISDRGRGSFISYNSSMLGFDKEILANFLHVAMLGVEPTITVLLDIPVKVAVKRTEQRAEKSRFDTIGEGFLRKQHGEFLKLSQSFSNWVVINGAMPIQDVHEEIKKHIETIKNI